jgi:hypothetical protein
MLKTEVYLKTASDFGVYVGIANAVRFSPLTDSKSEVDKSTYKRMSSDLMINKIITECIEIGEYKTLQRELYRIKRSKGKRKISELTIYREAMKTINSLKKSKKENGSKTSTKPRQIYSY